MDPASRACEDDSGFAADAVSGDLRRRAFMVGLRYDAGNDRV